MLQHFNPSGQELSFLQKSSLSSGHSAGASNTGHVPGRGITAWLVLPNLSAHSNPHPLKQHLNPSKQCLSSSQKSSLSTGHSAGASITNTGHVSGDTEVNISWNVIESSRRQNIFFYYRNSRWKTQTPPLSLKAIPGVFSKANENRCFWKLRGCCILWSRAPAIFAFHQQSERKGLKSVGTRRSFCSLRR